MLHLYYKLSLFLLENNLMPRLRVVRSDNGMEFHSGPIQDFYTARGITIQSSCVDTPQQNGVVERKHQHLL